MPNYILDCTLKRDGCVRRVSEGSGCRQDKDCKGILVCKEKRCRDSRPQSKLINYFLYIQMHEYAENFKTVKTIN